jgi:hypothetical protein
MEWTLKVIQASGTDPSALHIWGELDMTGNIWEWERMCMEGIITASRRRRTRRDPPREIIALRRAVVLGTRRTSSIPHSAARPVPVLIPSPVAGMSASVAPARIDFGIMDF